MFRIEAILDEKYYRDDVPTAKAVVVNVADRTRLEGLLAMLNKHVSLADQHMAHLKRVQSIKGGPCRVFVCLAKAQQDPKRLVEDDALQELLDSLPPEDVGHELVPVVAPLTRQQFKFASKLWAINFYEDKHISKCLQGTLFDERQRTLIGDRMQQALDMGRDSALIVRNNFSELVACVSSRQPTVDPLGHATLVAIETVAEAHRTRNSQLSFDEQDYLCTGYDCFLGHEPCIGCAMALVHARIKRVFFLLGDDGADQPKTCVEHAFTEHRIHTLPSLNHHYQVFALRLDNQDDDDDDANIPSKKVRHS